ncbi:TRAP transporter small permease subunit [Alcaligenaceae bacterium]|nr:TRAP transporter small permease subunit [Alcaligenaceae bacterium]
MSHDVLRRVEPDDGPWLIAYGKFVKALCRVTLAIATILVIFDLVVVGVAVLMRYLFSVPMLGGDEVVAFSLTAIVMFAAPDVLRRNGHIGVDILIDLLPARIVPWTRIWACLAVFATSALLIINGWKAVALSRMIGSLTEGHLELPIWMLQLLLPLGGVLLAIVAMEILWRSIIRVVHPFPVTEGDQ